MKPRSRQVRRFAATVLAGGAAWVSACRPAVESSDSAGSLDLYAAPQTAENAAAEAPSQPAAESESPTPSTPPLDSEVEEFGRTWVSRVGVGSGNLVNPLLDWSALERRALEGIDCPLELKRKFVLGLRRMRSGPDGFDAEMAQLVGAKGSCGFLRATTAPDGRKFALFRVVTPSRESVNYHRIEIQKSAFGDVRGVDVYIYRSGLSVSEIFRNSFLNILADDPKTDLDRLDDADRDYVVNRDVLRRMQSQISEDRFREALETYETLTPSMQRRRSALILRLEAAAGVDLAASRAALDAYRASLPGEGSMELLAAGIFAQYRQYERAQSAIDRFDQAIGGDPYLNVLRSRMYLADGDASRAKETALLATEALPDLVDGYRARIAVSLHEKAYPETIEIIETIAQRFGRSVDQIVADPVFSDFVKSTEWRAWLASRRPPPDAATKTQ